MIILLIKFLVDSVNLWLKKGDIALGISTSGNSLNVKNGLIDFKKKWC